MKIFWQQHIKRGTLLIFDRTLFKLFSGFNRLHRAASVRRIWGDVADNNSIHYTASRSKRGDLSIVEGVSIGANCRLQIGEGAQISLHYVCLEPNVCLIANAGTIEVGYGTYINTGTFMWTEGAILRIGHRVLIGPHCVVSAANHGIQNSQQPIIEQPITSVGITIGDNVWIGAGAIVCDGVTIGADTVIAAGAVVTKDIPANVVAGGVPCRVLRSRETAQ